MNSNSHTPIYRFKIIQNELEVEMNRFAILNQYNNHKELKEKYELWLNNSDILQLFQRETQLLREYNYDFKKHNLETKIFNSIKYYYIFLISLKSMNSSTLNIFHIFSIQNISH